MGTLLNRWWRGEEENIAIDAQASRLIVLSRVEGAASPPKEWIIPLTGLRPSRPSDEGSSAARLVSDLLKTHLADMNFRYARIGVSLPSESTLLAHHPDLFCRPFSELERVKEWASQFLSLNEQEHRVRVIPYPCGEGYERCLIAASKRAAVELWERVADALGVDLMVVAPRVSSLIRHATHAGIEDGHQSSVWVDMIEQPPSAHRFNGVVPVESIVMSDVARRDELIHRLCRVEKSANGEILEQDNIPVIWLLSEGQIINEVAQSMSLGSRLSPSSQCIGSESFAALGVLLIMEDS